MHPLLETIYRTGLVEDAEGNTWPQEEAAVKSQTGASLDAFIRRHRPRHTLEVGMAFGVSSLWICHALRECDGVRHTAIDPGQISSYASIGLLNIERAGFDDLFRFIGERSDVALPRLRADGERFDFVFIDGNHLFDYVLVDFFFIDQLLQVGGHIAFDDLWMPSVRKALSFVLRNRAYEMVPNPGAERHGGADRLKMAGRRILQTPFARSPALTLLPYNVAFVRKRADDDRSWHFHRTF